MNSKGLDFRKKDVTADLNTGIIKEIIVPGENKIFGIFSTNDEIIIPWSSIKCISDEIILVEI